MSTALAASLSERDLSDNIVALARMTGWLIHRDPSWRATGTDAGYPDITLTKDGRTIWFELKSERGKLTAGQWLWACALGEHFYVIRPSQWFAGEVDRILR